MSREELKERNFDGLGIRPSLQKRLKALGFLHPTPIQYKAIPVANNGEDLVGIAQTGSGKTLAFSLPMLQRIADTKRMGLVLLPTRELAVQVQETLNKVAGAAGLRTALIIGGTSPGPQIRQLKQKPHIIIATPGRLIDLIEQKHASIKNVGTLVLDEADRMLDMGFAPQLNQIMRLIPGDRQTMLFSATMPDEITKIAHQYMKEPLRVEVAKPGTTADKIDQEVFLVERGDKLQLLERLLNEYHGTILIFSRTKHGASKIARQVRKMGHKTDELHSNRSQNQRQKALKGFSSGKYRVLVATDIAARGIDVSNIELVINFDLPDQIDDYVHRIGRTGRAGREGKAISFASPDQKRDIQQIQKLIKIELPIKSPSGKALEPIKSHAPQGQKSRTNGKRVGGKRVGKRGNPSNQQGYRGRRSGGPKRRK